MSEMLETLCGLAQINGEVAAMKKKWSESAHIKELGPVIFDQLFVKALLLVKQDNRLIGADSLRRALAHEIVLRYTGAPFRAFIYHRLTGEYLDEIVEAVAAKMKETEHGHGI